MLTASLTDGPALHTKSHNQNSSDATSTPHPDTTPQISQNPPLHQNHSQLNVLMPYYKCKELAHSASAFPEDY